MHAYMFHPFANLEVSVGLLIDIGLTIHNNVRRLEASILSSNQSVYMISCALYKLKYIKGWPTAKIACDLIACIVYHNHLRTSFLSRVRLQKYIDTSFTTVPFPPVVDKNGTFSLRRSPIKSLRPIGALSGNKLSFVVA